MFPFSEYQEQKKKNLSKSSKFSIPCLLFLHFALAVQPHLEDQHLPVHTENFTLSKRFLGIKGKM